ncbi:tetratricopeptide repeat-containing sensor histidine kinase [Flavobacterium sp. PLA-1-15]|uniref:tetratricopeptide repeat-containing sensor histidine kinase n=1 Tax=Flavobacterium sp. PLA-1-15 TaxID=3380533 RepID=UPI003B774644
MPKRIWYKKLKRKFCFVFLLLFTLPAFAQTTKVEELLKELKPKLPDTTRMRIYQQLTTAYASVDQDKKYYYAVRYKAIAEKLKVDTLVVEAYIDMGGTHAIKTKMDSALFYFAKGYETAKKIKYERGMARALASMGYVYEKIDNDREAIDKYKEALRLYKKIKYAKGINQCYINIGGIYHDLGEYKVSQTYDLLALESYKKIGHEPGIASALFSLGGGCLELGEYEKAINYFQESLEIRERIGDINGIALARWGLARVDIKKGAFAKALPNLEIALKHDIELKNTFHESAVLISFARAYVGLKQYKKAREYAERAYENSKKMESLSMRSKAVWMYMKIEEAQNNFEGAYKYQNAFIELTDSIKSEEKLKHLVLTEFNRVSSENEGLVKDNKIIATKNTSYVKTIFITSVILLFVVILLVLYYKRNLEKKATNLLLEKQKDEISEINKELEMLNEELTTQMEITAVQNSELEQLNKVKNKFFSIVSHDLRSPLQTLKMLFGLYREGQLNESELNSLLARLEDTIYTTSVFLDNLLEWSKSQLDGMTVRPLSFDVREVVKTNIHLHQSAIKAKELRVNMNIDQSVLVYADPNMINVVVRNLISNAVKFCNAEDSITISATEKGEKVKICINDSGPGIASRDIEKLFSLEHTITTSVTGEKGHQIGLVLCKDMVEQNDGKISVESILGEGTTFCIYLPKG